MTMIAGLNDDTYSGSKESSQGASNSSRPPSGPPPALTPVPATGGPGGHVAPPVVASPAPVGNPPVPCYPSASPGAECISPRPLKRPARKCQLMMRRFPSPLPGLLPS
ncbi:hypothetical protein TYRP_007118 [Tyrophagus putrescentiae]|nr:hypothetical protein TYRP_007118 [Tyrophagus putrescentiae]